MINFFSTPVDTALVSRGGLEALTVNGHLWPITEHQTPAVGETADLAYSPVEPGAQKLHVG